MTQKTGNIISFADAYQFLKKFRYKPRKEWSKNERSFFKICNFIILSKKRVNKILSALNSFYKLSDKSHYSFKTEDILIIKDVILENLEQGLKNFEKNIRILKEEDVQKLKEHFNKMKEDNLRLHNENERLQSIIVNYINEGKLHEISELEDIFKKENSIQNREFAKLKEVDEKKLQKFLTDWEAGKTTIDIKASLKSDIKNKKSEKA